MTGYGRGEAVDSICRMIVEIKTVNNRYCDIQIRIPRLLSSLENRIREQVQKSLYRGKIDIYVTYEVTGADAMQVRCDYQLAHAYADALRRIASAESIPDGLNAVQIARFNDVLQIEPYELPAEQTETLIEQALSDALTALCEMRSLEGNRLAADIRQRADQMLTQYESLGRLAPLVAELYRKRLTARIQEWFGDESEKLFSEERMAAEVAVYADKSAVDEELVRLKSHLQQLKSIVSLDEPVGKKLDFIVQEINREINTIGSKANDLSMVQTVVSMKSELEKIREQIQNLE